MASAVGRESFFWHKLHSLTGIVPVGFYLIQHLALNSFSLVGPAKYNGISSFFYGIPEHILLTIEAVFIWIPLAFHMVYGLFITRRAENNYLSTPYKWPQNRMYLFQRVTGVFLAAFLVFHIWTTTVQVKLHGNDPSVVDYYSMQAQLTSFGYIVLALYLVGVLAASYHLSYGVWNFCIRWGITIGEDAQRRVQRFAFAMFILVTVLGWAALFGFLRHRPRPSMEVLLPKPAPGLELRSPDSELYRVIVVQTTQVSVAEA